MESIILTIFLMILMLMLNRHLIIENLVYVSNWLSCDNLLSVQKLGKETVFSGSLFTVFGKVGRIH